MVSVLDIKVTFGSDLVEALAQKALDEVERKLLKPIHKRIRRNALEQIWLDPANAVQLVDAAEVKMRNVHISTHDIQDEMVKQGYLQGE